MSMVCPVLSPQGPAEIDMLLASIDCYSHAAVTGAYSRLFGTSGMLGTVLTVALSLYLVFFAIQLMTGRTSLSLAKLMPRVFMIGGVLTIATSWPAYHQVIYGLLTGGPDELASGLLNQNHATLHFASVMQQLYEQILSASASLAEVKMTAGSQASNIATAGDLLWVSGVMMLLGTAGVLVVAKLMLALLLALGPVFALFAIFSATRGMAEGWLRTAVLFALVPLIVTLLGRTALVALSPLVASLTWANTPGGDPVSSVLTLFAGTLIYLSLLTIAVKTSYSLTKGWQPLGYVTNPTYTVNSAPGPALPDPQPYTSGVSSVASSSSSSPTAESTHQVVTALLKDHSPEGGANQAADHNRVIFMQPQTQAAAIQPQSRRLITPPRRSHGTATRSRRPLSGVIGQ